MPVQQAEVFDKVRTCLVDALGVDEEEVTPEATMVGDLGAESIDFLDIVFRLEKTSTLKFREANCFPKTFSPTPSTCNDGKVSAVGLEQLKKRMPFADLSKFEADPRVTNFGNMLTVQDLVNYVQSKLPQ